MKLSLTTIVVPEYDAAIDYYVNALGFHLLEDTQLNNGKRWVVVSPSLDCSHGLLLARAASDEQRSRIGNQTGGRVAFFLETDDFHATHSRLQKQGVEFTESPRNESYGTVAVFKDAFGNRWDLIEPQTNRAKDDSSEIH